MKTYPEDGTTMRKTKFQGKQNGVGHLKTWSCQFVKQPDLKN